MGNEKPVLGHERPRSNVRRVRSRPREIIEIVVHPQRDTQPDSPQGVIYLDWAVTRIMGRFSCPPGFALNLLKKAMRLGELTARFDGHNANRDLGPHDWDNVKFDPDKYAKEVREGLPQASLLIGRQSMGPHAMFIPEHDFVYWLEEGPAAKYVREFVGVHCCAFRTGED